MIVEGREKSGQYFLGGTLLSGLYCFILYLTGELIVVWMLSIIILVMLFVKVKRNKETKRIVEIFAAHYKRFLIFAFGFQLIQAIIGTVIPEVFYSVFKVSRQYGGIVWAVYEYLPQADLSQMYRDHGLEVLWNVYEIFNISAIFNDMIVIIVSMLFCCALSIKRREAGKMIPFSDDAICASTQSSVVIAAVTFFLLIYLFGVFIRGHGLTEYTVLDYGFLLVSLNFLLRILLSMLLYMCVAVSVVGYACHLNKIKISESHDND